MNDTEYLELISNRLLTVEMIVDELMETLFDKGIIDRSEFKKSMDSKIDKLNEMADSIESDENNTTNMINLFNGPIGEA